MILPKITIITICYNADQTIRRTLRSVREQTYEAIEHIIVDGASQDATLALIQEYKTSRTHLYSEPDKGIYDAMNKGLGYASGDYVWFLNAGDALPTPETVSLVAEHIMNAPTIPDVVYGDCLLIDAEDRLLGLRRLRPPHELTWRSFIYGMTVCHQSFVARRELCPEYDLRYRFSADVDWCIRVLKRSRACSNVTAPLSLYLNEGATTANHRKSLLERFDVMRRHYGLLPTLGAHLFFCFRALR